MTDVKRLIPPAAPNMDASREPASELESERSSKDPSSPGVAIQRTRRLDFRSADTSPREVQSPAEPPLPPTPRLDFSGAPSADKTAEPHPESRSPEDQDDLANLSVEELQDRKIQVERKLLEKREAEKLAIINQIVEVVQTHSIPTDELLDALGWLPTKRKLGPAAQRYRDPETGATWSGRGKEPAWIRGKDRAKFRIP